MKQVVGIRLAHLSEGFGFGELVFIFQVANVNDHVQVVEVTLAAEHEIKVWNVSGALEELVEVGEFSLPELDERQLLEPDVVV